MKTILPFLLCMLLYSCKKTSPSQENLIPAEIESAYVEYTIDAGAHYCNNNIIKAVTVSEMNFKVKFDSSAVYTTTDTSNQYDINKLYGFSEGYDHHVNSARIGWSWNKNALRLYAYTYCNGIRDSKEITAVTIGSDINCGIQVSGQEYIFKVNDISVRMSRALETPVATGYQLYPYFGGDEVAPARIRILVKEIP